MPPSAVAHGGWSGCVGLLATIGDRDWLCVRPGWIARTGGGGELTRIFLLDGRSCFDLGEHSRDALDSRDRRLLLPDESLDELLEYALRCFRLDCDLVPLRDRLSGSFFGSTTLGAAADFAFAFVYKTVPLSKFVVTSATRVSQLAAKP